MGQFSVGANKQNTRTPKDGVAASLKPSDPIVNVTRFRTGNKIDLIPARLELAWTLKQPAGKENLLAKLLAKVKDAYDLVLIDCAPTESVLTTAAYLASDWILVPVKPEFLSTIGLPLLVRSLGDFLAQNEEKKLDLAGIVFNHASDYAPEEVKSKTEVNTEAARQGWYVFSNEVTYSRSYPKGAREGKPIFRTSYARSNQAAKFHSFAQEFASRVGL